MTPSINRWSFPADSAALAAATSFPRFASAQGAALKLSAASRSLDIDGEAAKVYGLVNASVGSGLNLNPGQRFAVDLTNDLDIK